jgi:hypothetical protein
MRMTFGRGGWVLVDNLGLPGPAYVRFANDAGRLRVAEFYLDASEGAAISSQDLGTFPLGLVEATASEDGYLLNPPRGGPDLSTLASYFATGPGSDRAMALAIAGGNWVMAAIASQFIGDGSYGAGEERSKSEGPYGMLGPPGKYKGRGRGRDKVVLTGDSGDSGEAPISVTVRRVPKASRKHERVRLFDPEFRLTAGPPGGRLTDDFLRDVGRAYAAAVARGERPNIAIAQQVYFGKRTVEGWVADARKRDLMPPGQKGSTTR